MVNLTKLNDAINDSGISKTRIAEKLSISRTSLFMKLKGIREFTASEIYKLKDVLLLPLDKFIEIFFADEREYKST